MRQNYKSYTDLSEADTKELAEAVTKLGEPLVTNGCYPRWEIRKMTDEKFLDKKWTVVNFLKKQVLEGLV